MRESGGSRTIPRVFRFAILIMLTLAACQTSEPRVFSDQPRAVPDLMGQGVVDARRVLEADGFLVDIELEGVSPEEQPDNVAAEKRCPTGVVRTQDPIAGTNVIKASTITIFVTGCG